MQSECLMRNIILEHCVISVPPMDFLGGNLCVKWVPPMGIFWGKFVC